LVWDAQASLQAGAAAEPARRISLRGAPFNDAAVNLDGSRLATIGEDGFVRVWELESEQEIRSFGPYEGRLLAVDVNEEGTLVAATEGLGIQVWDVATGEALPKLVGYCADEAFTEWEACEEAEQAWQGHKKAATALAFSPDGEILASGSADTTILFWSLETGQVVWSVRGPLGRGDRHGL
jgi:WD40 repeat protein